VTGITGPNGAGKTTVLRLLAGAETPAGGEVLWTQAMRSTGKSGPGKAGGVAYLPQRAWPGADWEAWARASRDARPELWKELDALLRLERLIEKAVHPEALSGGERQRMSLARVLASQASMLLLDEPVTALPGDEREDILRGALALWIRHAEHGARGAIIVSHEPFLANLCDTVLRIDETHGIDVLQAAAETKTPADQG
jgi:ATP-binding cassette subfamily B protein